MWAPRLKSFFFIVVILAALLPISDSRAQPGVSSMSMEMKSSIWIYLHFVWAQIYLLFYLFLNGSLTSHITLYNSCACSDVPLDLNSYIQDSISKIVVTTQYCHILLFHSFIHVDNCESNLGSTPVHSDGRGYGIRIVFAISRHTACTKSQESSRNWVLGSNIVFNHARISWRNLKRFFRKYTEDGNIHKVTILISMQSDSRTL